MTPYRPDCSGSEEEYEKIKRAGRQRLTAALILALCVSVSLGIVLSMPPQSSDPQSITVSHRIDTADFPSPTHISTEAVTAAPPVETETVKDGAHFTLSILPNPMTCRPNACATETDDGTVSVPTRTATDLGSEYRSATSDNTDTAVLDTPAPLSADNHIEEGGLHEIPFPVTIQPSDTMPSDDTEMATSAVRDGQIRFRNPAHETVPAAERLGKQSRRQDTETAAPPTPEAIQNASICQQKRCRIQIGAYRAKSAAEEVQAKLARAGITAFISEVDHNGTTLYRVRTGSPSHSSLQSYIAKIRELGYDISLLAAE